MYDSRGRSRSLSMLAQPFDTIDLYNSVTTANRRATTQVRGVLQLCPVNSLFGDRFIPT